MSPPEAASGQTQLLERGWKGISEAGATLTRAGLRLADRPLPVLGGLVAVQWLALLAFALTVRHNGLVFYQGGDQINYCLLYTSPSPRDKRQSRMPSSA